MFLYTFNAHLVAFVGDMQLHVNSWVAWAVPFHPTLGAGLAYVGAGNAHVSGGMRQHPPQSSVPGPDVALAGPGGGLPLAAPPTGAAVCSSDGGRQPPPATNSVYVTAPQPTS